MKAISMVLVLMILSIFSLNVSAIEMGDMPMMYQQNNSQEQQQMQQAMYEARYYRGDKLEFPSQEQVSYKYDYSFKDLQKLPQEAYNYVKEQLQSAYNSLSAAQKDLIDYVRDLISSSN